MPVLANAKTTGALSAMPVVVAGELSISVFDATGARVMHAGTDDGSEITVSDGRAVVEAAAGRAALQCALPEQGAVAVITYDAAVGTGVEPFLSGFFDLLIEQDRFDGDMESINKSSLALLEEVSMVGDTLPSLPTGRSVHEVAEMGLKALVVAASVHRALYVQYDQATGYAEVLVQVGMDASGRSAVGIPYRGTTVIGDDARVVWDAIQGPGDAVLRSVGDGPRLGPPGTPEHLAEHELIAVPVHYGQDDKRVVLGVVLVMDKRENAYSTSDHLGSQETKLATSIASMLGSVLGTRKVAELGNELRMANEIQQQILPAGTVAVPGFDIAGRCTNSGAVGGDYFDYLPMADGSTLVVVADVSGHNLASGMIMVGARATLRALASSSGGVDRVFDALARTLYQDLVRTERFITAVGAAIRPDSGRVSLSNAGHNDTMVYRAATGAIERIPSDTTVLGFLPEPDHPLQTLELQPGDVMVLYTDGVVEATNDGDEMLGEEGLERVLIGAASGSAEQILRTVFEAVDAFADKKVAGDDITAVVIKVPPTGA